MTVTLADIAFDTVDYDRDGDILYLHRGAAGSAVDFAETPEGHALRFDGRGELVGVTIINPRWLLEREGTIGITLPRRRLDLDAAQLGHALVAA